MVLHLANSTEWDASQEAALQELVEQARTAGRNVDDPVALALFHLESLGAFADELRILDPNGAVQGRNLGSTPTPGGVKLSSVHTVRPTSGGNSVKPEFSPWSRNGEPTPYILVADVDETGPVLRLPQDVSVRVSDAEVFALLSADPELRRAEQDRPVLLLVSGLGAAPRQAQQQQYSREHHRPAISYSGEVALSGATPSVPSYVTAGPESDSGEAGTWYRTPDQPQGEAAPAVRKSQEGRSGDGSPAADGRPQSPEGTPYTADEHFDARFAHARKAFPVVTSTARSTVWGQGGHDPNLRVFVAEIPALGLRGEYNPEGPAAGRVTDGSGCLRARGPAWDWYIAGRGLVASSWLRMVPPGQGSGDGRGPEAGRDDEGVVPVPDVGPATGSVRSAPPVPPAAVAAAPHLVVPGAIPDALWRDHMDSLYKFSLHAPEQVFREGLLPGGTEWGLLTDRTYGNDRPRTVYVSTTASRNYVRDFARANPDSAYAPDLHRRYRWRYDIEIPGGIDVNATLGLASTFPDQQEVLFPGGVHPRFIRGAQPLEAGLPVGKYLPNPDFDPPPVSHLARHPDDEPHSEEGVPTVEATEEGVPTNDRDTPGSSTAPPAPSSTQESVSEDKNE